MKRILLLSIVALVGAAPLRAQETVEYELELVRKLREKGWSDFAKKKIEDLLKRGDPTLNAALPLELAEINISMARQLDPDQRATLFAAARTQLQDFIKQNQGKGQAALASVKLARLTSYQAQAILSRAMREDDLKSKHEKARPAETMFIQAGKDLEAAIQAIDAALPTAAPTSLKNLLEQEKRQLRFDIAVNLFDQAKTYVDKDRTATSAARTNTMEKARKAFEELRSDESSQNGWLANAWLMKVAMEQTDRDKVVSFYNKVIAKEKAKTVDPAVVPAIRLVRYFHIQDLTLPRADEVETIGDNAIGSLSKFKKSGLDRLHDVQKEGEAWLKAYPNSFKTYEGQGVRYELGQAYLTEAFEVQKKDAKAAKKLFDLASSHFKTLGDYDGDLAERARQLAMSIEFTTVAEGKTELRTFDQFMMKAMIERRNVIETSKKMDAAKPDERKALEDARKKQLKDVIVALNRALALADARTSIQKTDDARYYLCGAYVAYGDLQRAAIVGEALGRARSTRRSPEGAATAIQTYSTLQARNPDDASIRKRLDDLAAFVLSPEAQTTWKNDPVTSLAHYHLAMAAKGDDPKTAITHLQKISPDFMDYIYTQGQLVFIAQAAREKTEDKKEQAFYVKAIKDALARMPTYNKEDSPSVITMYYFAKLEMSKFMYSEAIAELSNPAAELKAVKKLTEMSKYVKDLHDQLDKLPGKTISSENREQIELTMSVMLKYADLGIAETRFRSITAGKARFDQVIAITQNAVNDVLKRASTTPPGEHIKLKDHKVTGDILSLALRANVQKGDAASIAKGKAILDALQRLADEKGNPTSARAVAVLLNDIAGQIRTMTATKDSSLAETSKSYDAFLDLIAKEYESKPYDHNATIMLAHAYSSLQKPQKAAALFAKVKPPEGLDKPIVVPKNEDDKAREARLALEEQFSKYWAVQIEYIRALRACKDKESLKTAESTVNVLLKHPNAKYQLQGMMEKNLILEDQERYREAYIDWSQKFMKMRSLTDRLQDKEVQKIYFTGYFHTARTLFKMAKHDPKITDRDKFIKAAANMILKLETSKSREGWEIAGPKFAEILEDPEYRELKKAYDQLKSQTPPKGGK
jgi:hypothetical protein